MNDSPAPELSPAACLWAVVAITFLAHLPFALFDRPFQDGWIHELLFERGYPGENLQLLLDNGRPVAGWLNLAAMQVTGSGHGAVWMSVLSVVVAGAGWYLACLRSGLFSPRLCLTMAVVAAVTPANQIIVSSPTVIFVSAHAFFALGLWLFMEARVAKSVTWRGAAYATACACAVMAALLGEATAPMLVLYPIMMMLATLKPVQRPPAAGQAAALLLRHSAPVALGCLAFAAMFVLYPPIGATAVTERRITFDPVLLGLSAVTFGVTVLIAYAGFWGVVLAMLRHERLPRAGVRMLLLAVAALMAVLAIGPYVAALRLASPTGWGGRYLYYFGGPLALLVAAIAPLHDSRGRLDIALRWSRWLCAAVVLGLLVRWPFLAARTVHEDAVAMAAARSPLLGDVQVVVVDDPGDVIAAPLRDQEWTGLLQRGMDRQGTLAAVGYPRAPDTAWSRIRLELRRKMGWATEHPPKLTPTFLGVSMQAQQRTQVVKFPAGTCRVALLTVAPQPLSSQATALAWYVRARFQPDAYRGWLIGQVPATATVAQLPHLSLPCP